MRWIKATGGFGRTQTVVAWGVICLACGGKTEDTTRIVPPPPPPPAEFDVAESAALETLARPETREAFCGWLGAAAAQVGAGAGDAIGDVLECEQVVEQCRDSVGSAAELGGAPDLPLGLVGLPNDLEELLGCPSSLYAVDACAAELLELIVSRAPVGSSCSQPMAASPLELADLLTLDSCASLVLECPELLRGLLDALG